MDLDEAGPSAAPSRRGVLRGAVVAGAAVPFLVACGSSDEGDAATTPETSPTSGGGADGGGATAGGGGAGADAIAQTADVPEGGGVILDSPAIVLTQPAAGTFKGFSPVCTHQGCTVSSVSDGTINCPCHGSQFSIEDGSVVTGPATTPLAAMDVTVDGTSISLA